MTTILNGEIVCEADARRIVAYARRRVLVSAWAR